MSMLANCSRCGNLFDKRYRDICPHCIEEEEQDLQVVKDYLGNHRLATLPEVVRDTEVPLETVLTFIDDRRLVLVDFPNLTYQCQQCGTHTQNGRYCQECTDNLVQELADATESVRKLKDTPPPVTGGYHSR
jgi:flagellar operon protein (TIGR03826 family)